MVLESKAQRRVRSCCVFVVLSALRMNETPFPVVCLAAVTPGKPVDVAKSETKRAKNGKCTIGMRDDRQDNSYNVPRTAQRTQLLP